MNIFKRFFTWFRSLWDDDMARLIMIHSVLGRVLRNNPGKRARLEKAVQEARQFMSRVPLTQYTKDTIYKEALKRVDPLDYLVVKTLLDKAFSDWENSPVAMSREEVEKVNRFLDQVAEVIQASKQ